MFFSLAAGELLKIQKQLQDKLNEQEYTPPIPAVGDGTAAALATKAKEYMQKGSFVEAAVHYARAISTNERHDGKSAPDSALVSDAKQHISTLLQLRQKEQKTRRHKKTLRRFVSRSNSWF